MAMHRLVEMLSTLWAKPAGVALVAVGALAAASVAVGAGLAVSNILRFGPSTLVLESVTLTQVQNLPSTMKLGQTYNVRFQVTNDGSALTGVTLKTRLSASGATLSDPSRVDVVFEDRSTSTKSPVTMQSVGGSLEGTLRSSWSIPVGYTGEFDIEFTFKQGAPLASYSVDVWVEGGDAAAGTPGPGAQTYEVSATDNDTFVPSQVTISAGDTIRWTNVGSRPHNVVVTAPGGSQIRVSNLLSGGQSVQQSFTQSGSHTYICEFHSGMQGTFTVQ